MSTPNLPRRLPTIVVLGPTGSGKSELALMLAQRFYGEIVNCDSVQVYRGLDIGSAKTAPENRGDVLHHLVDVIGPNEELSAGSYARVARQVIAEICVRGRVPVIVGGTGFYLRAFFEGLSPAPGRDVRLRNRLQQLASRRRSVLHRILRRYDPIAAGRIHPNDNQKLIRAIEITLLSGTPATQAQKAPKQALTGIAPLKIGLLPERKLLYSRLNERTAWMFRNGLLAETERLLEFGYSFESKPMQSLGYKQAVQVIQGKMSLDCAIAECQVRTRQYAKRQITWFRPESNVNWLCGFGSEMHIKQMAIERSRTYLSGLHDANE